jgi:hypothetical protein
MPKENKKGQRQGGRAAIAETDGDFDDMLAEVRAAVLADCATVSSSVSRSSGSCGTTSATITNVVDTAASAANAIEVPEERILEAVERGNIGQLRRWARQGLHIKSGLPLLLAANLGKLDVVQSVVNELGADVNEPNDNGSTPLCIAAIMADLAMVRCLVKELQADVNKADHQGYTPLWIAPQAGHLAIVQCLVKELNADMDQTDRLGGTPLMLASAMKHADIVKWLIKAGADAQATCHNDGTGTALDVSKTLGASAEQTAYLEAKTHCTRQGCSGAGIKKCTGCKQARYCGEACQLAHWKAHKADCRRWSAELEASIKGVQAIEVQSNLP